MKNNEIAFTHRPITGVSVGAYSDGAYLYIAAAFTNDGTSRNGYYHSEHDDCFSRSLARKIIAGRIQHAQDTFQLAGQFLGNEHFTVVLATDMSAADFMRNFREVFKSDIAETDDFLHDTWVDDDSNLSVRARMRVSDMWMAIDSLAKDTMSIGVETTGS